ncbi:MAG: YbaB/EbfC family nucleoid-associated protein [Alphaproteobacteria bacterium]
MKNLGQLMKQAQEMQNRMQEMQQKLAEIELEGTSAGGMVKVTVNGRSEMRRVKIDPALVDPKEVEVLEDLVVAAFNDAKAKVEARVAEEMQKLTGGLPLPPGLKLPF